MLHSDEKKPCLAVHQVRSMNVRLGHAKATHQSCSKTDAPFGMSTISSSQEVAITMRNNIHEFAN